MKKNKEKSRKSIKFVIQGAGVALVALTSYYPLYIDAGIRLSAILFFMIIAVVWFDTFFFLSSTILSGAIITIGGYPVAALFIIAATIFSRWLFDKVRSVSLCGLVTFALFFPTLALYFNVMNNTTLSSLAWAGKILGGTIFLFSIIGTLPNITFDKREQTSREFNDRILTTIILSVFTTIIVSSFMSKTHFQFMRQFSWEHLSYTSLVPGWMGAVAVYFILLIYTLTIKNLKGLIFNKTKLTNENSRSKISKKSLTRLEVIKFDHLKALAEKHKRELSFYRYAFDAVDSVIIFLDDAFKIVSGNKKIKDFFPIQVNDLIGLDLLDFFDLMKNIFTNKREVFQFIKNAMIETECISSIETGLTVGTMKRCILFTAPICNSEGALIGRVLTLKDITEQFNLRNKLIEKNRELEAFVYTVSHDLKNPISVILGIAELMETQFEEFLDEEGREYISMLREESQKMLNMIDDMLQLSRIERGKIEMEDVDTISIVNDIVAEFQHIYRDIPVVFIIQESLPVIKAQGMMLGQVFKNIISNSIKYSDPQKPRTIIEIGYYLKEGFHHFYVKDNGLGLTEEEKKHIFEMFYRTGEKEIEGTGLGTSIVKKIIEAHGGKVWITSRKGEGSTFTFTIPAI